MPKASSSCPSTQKCVEKNKPLTGGTVKGLSVPGHRTCPIHPEPNRCDGSAERLPVG